MQGKREPRPRSKRDASYKSIFARRRTGGRWLYILVLLEFQSTIDPR